MTTQQPVAGGALNSNSFSLFPNPNVSRPPPPPVIRLHPNPRPKRTASRERARQEQQQQLQQNHEQQQQHQRLNTPPERFSDSESPESSPPRIDTTMLPQQQIPATNTTTTTTTTTHTPLQFDPVSSSVASPQPVASVPGRSSSVRSRSSIAKPPLFDDDGGGGGAGGPSSSSPSVPAPLRSIFPTYNPELPLDQQAYGPTQLSPSHIPRAAISRQSYYDPEAMSIGQAYTTTATEPMPELPQREEQQPRGGPPPRYHQQQDTVAFSAVHRAHPRANSLSPPVVPTTSTTDQLKTFWKAANGWKAAPSEGRVFCLKLSQLKDAPVYTLSSASQPFYTLRLDPTSASALVSLSRHDPAKTYKLPKPEPSSSSSSPGGSDDAVPKRESKHWQEVLRTTMEEESRRRPPGDGLVALLMPSPAAKMAIERADEPHLVAMAERECARLVWDDDSACHYLAHPALAAPFVATVRRCPAWSRVEYTLEHHESPRHLAKLTRDGTGSGWLEVDTAVAAHVEAYYIIDVAVAALLLVAAADERSGNGAVVAGGAFMAGMEAFEPPPAPPPVAARSESRGSGRFSRLSTRREDKKKRRPMEEFELDLESQDGSLSKSSRAKSKRRKSKVKEEEDKLPFLVRACIKVAKGVFKCVIWVLTALFRVLFSCVRSKY